MKRIFENLPEPGRERKYFSLSSLSSKHPENIFFHCQVLAESHLLFKSSFSWVELSVSDPVPETFHDSPKFWDPWRSRRLVTPESSKSLRWLSGKTTFCWNLIWMIRIMVVLRIMKTMWIFVMTNMKNLEIIRKSPKVLSWLIVNCWVSHWLLTSAERPSSESCTNWVTDEESRWTWPMHCNARTGLSLAFNLIFEWTG